MKAQPLAKLHSRLKMRHLLLLRALGLAPNLRRAATSLGLSQPVASTLLKELENAFEERLFERTARGLEPTAAGVALTSWAQLMLADLEAARDDLQAVSRGRTRRLRIGISPLGTPSLLPRALDIFFKAYPEATFAIQTGVETALVSACLRGDLDCVVCRLLPEAALGALKYYPLHSERSDVVVGAQHPLAGAFAPAELDKYAWVLPLSEGPPYELVARRLLAEGCKLPRVVVETWSTVVITNLLRHNDWLAVLPHSIARQGVAAGVLAVLPIELPDTLLPLAVIIRKAAPANENMLGSLVEALQVASQKISRSV